MKDNFLEKWILDLVKSEYEVGNISKNATYKFKEQKDDFVEVTVEWINKENVECKTVYRARAFGKKNQTNQTEVLNNPIFKMEKYYTLEIHTYIDHIKRSYSTRKIVDYDVKNVIGQLDHLEKIRKMDIHN
ncbi:hypothetical protein [Flagellimonas meridianipacifica]|uniref:Uncharacterized protein n=1 Tax=Flagellimonas meridianipacifica TaxID=1080225 RepID=A0A2T0MIR7_9FLAO|nr:hypothetical protein [Allomuricauda pacifica]PRX57445.1 hypothetical protein CLV81_1450 [Allomuricauda pacifica]